MSKNAEIKAERILRFRRAFPDQAAGKSDAEVYEMVKDWKNAYNAKNRAFARCLKKVQSA